MMWAPHKSMDCCNKMKGIYFLLLLLKCMDIESNPGPLNSSAEALPIPTPSGLTPLHQAATNNDADEVGKLLMQGHDPNALNETPLHIAARNGNLNIAKKLLTCGADPNASDISNTTPLHLVVDCSFFSNDRRQLLDILILMGSDVNATNQDGETALSIATRHKNLNVVTLLIQNGASVEAVKTLDGWNLLHIAAEINFTAILPVLEQTASLFLQTMACMQTDTAGWTPLQVAIRAGARDFAMELIERGLVPVSSRDIEACTSLHFPLLTANKRVLESSCKTFDLSEEANLLEEPDWSQLKKIRAKEHLLPKDDLDLNMNLALHRYLTFPADYDARAGVPRADLAHSGFYAVHDIRSLQCNFCTYEIESLVGWRGITLEEMNQRHAVASIVAFRVCCPLMAGQDVGDVPFLYSAPTNYRFEAHRLFSFLRNPWPNSKESVYDLAKCGFHYSGEEDIFWCHFCDLEVSGWEPGGITLQKHHQWKPNCMFAMNKAATDNVDIGQELAARSSEGDDQNPFCKTDLSKRGAQFTSFGNNWLSLERLGIILCAKAYPQFKTILSRLKSYADWPPQLSQTPDTLARAGFFYTGTGDRVVCFQCGGAKEDWEPDESPWNLHAKWFSNCPLLYCQGRTNGPAVTTDLCRNSEEPGEMTCTMCQAADINCVSLPCGHMTTCVECVEVEKYCNRCLEKKMAFFQVFPA